MVEAWIAALIAYYCVVAVLAVVGLVRRRGCEDGDVVPVLSFGLAWPVLLPLMWAARGKRGDLWEED